MKRRNFINSISLASVSLVAFPYTGYSNSSSTESLKGINILSSTLDIHSFRKFNSSFNKIEQQLQSLNITIKSDLITKLNENCYIIPVKKESAFGNENKVLLLIDKNASLSHYIVDEQLISEYDSFIKSYIKTVDSQNISRNTLSNFTPLSIDKNKTNELTFRSKNCNVTLKKVKGKTYTLIS